MFVVGGNASFSAMACESIPLHSVGFCAPESDTQGNCSNYQTPRTQYQAYRKKQLI